MIIKGKLFDSLKEEVQKVLDNHKLFSSFKEIENYYVTNKIGSKDYRMRARWDILWATPKEFRNEFFDTVYNQLSAHDSHVDTALKRITGIR